MRQDDSKELASQRKEERDPNITVKENLTLGVFHFKISRESTYKVHKQAIICNIV